MKELKNKVWFPYSVLMVGMVCIAFSPIFIKLAGISGLLIAFYRSLIASVVLVPLWFINKNVKVDRKGIGLGILAGIFFAFDLMLWSISLFYSLTATSTLLANLAPVWVGFGTLFILHEKLAKNYWKGLAIAIVGTMIIIGINQIIKFSIGLGNMLAIGASFFYAGYLLVAQKSRTQIDTISFTAIMVVTCALVLFGICIFQNESFTNVPTKSWFYIIALGLVSHLGGWLSINYALGHIKASVASVSLLGQPVIAAILAMFLLGEWLSFWQILGGIVVLTGIYFVNRE